VSVPGTEAAPLETELRETLTAQLSIYKCPRNIRFIDEIPRTATGKIQRYKLREML
jgi:benzoate-CoA ligase